jgi:hypothetical protein
MREIHVNTDATRAHIDAETMAAWAEHGLSAEAAAAVELHLSNCERCQEVLAAFVRSTPAAGAVVLPFWSRRPVQWSAAGLAAAAAIVAMIWIGRPPAVTTPETTVAMRDEAPAAPPAPIDRIAPSSQPSPSSQSSIKPAPAELRKEGSVAAAQQKSASAAKQRQDRPSPALTDRAAPNEAAAKKTESRAVPVPPPPPAAVIAPPVTVGGAAAVAASPPVPRPAAVSEAVATDAFSAITFAPTFEIAAPLPSPSALRSAADASRVGAGGRGRGAGVGALNQNNAPTRWRVVGGTRIERTVDAGANWSALPIDPELKTPLVAGSATSSTNCWLVGRDGVVLVTNDGRTFRRVSVPEAVHLTAVEAQDALHATVRTIDGRTFTTSDGGLSWK